MNDPITIDENHPGWKNLSRKEQRRFKDLFTRDNAHGDLSPEKEADLDNLIDIIKNGRPIDENHPGFDNLNPEQPSVKHYKKQLKDIDFPLSFKFCLNNPNLTSYLKSIGYKEIFGYLDGNYDLEEAVRLLKRNTRRYAKRQLTWFKKDEEYTWFHPNELDQILKHIQLQIQLSKCGLVGRFFFGYSQKAA